MLSDTTIPKKNQCPRVFLRVAFVSPGSFGSFSFDEILCLFCDPWLVALNGQIGIAVFLDLRKEIQSLIDL
jgi:hypothetical protein